MSEFWDLLWDLLDWRYLLDWRILAMSVWWNVFPEMFLLTRAAWLLSTACWLAVGWVMEHRFSSNTAAVWVGWLMEHRIGSNIAAVVQVSPLVIISDSLIRTTYTVL